MTWVKLDDQILAHPKIVRAGRDARDLFIAGLCYCASHLTDGFIPHGALRMLGGLADIDDPQASAQRLIEVGLWEQTDDSYVVHDYLDYQPTREKAEAIKEARQRAGSKGGQISVEVKRQAKRQANAWAKSEHILTPSPSPYPEEELSSSKVISGIFAADVTSSGADAPSQPAADADRETPETPPATRRHAPINPLWDALVAIFGYEPRTPAERSKWGKIVKHLKDAKATPEDVQRAKANYDRGVDLRVYTWSLTPNALDNHLGELLKPPRAPTPSQPRASPRGMPVGAAAAALANRPIRSVDDAVPDGY